MEYAAHRFLPCSPYHQAQPQSMVVMATRSMVNPISFLSRRVHASARKLRTIEFPRNVSVTNTVVEGWDCPRVTTVMVRANADVRPTVASPANDSPRSVPDRGGLIFSLLAVSVWDVTIAFFCWLCNGWEGEMDARSFCSGAISAQYGWGGWTVMPFR